jgi:hypothetical protein
MTVVLLVEGDTESALREHLKRFLDQRATQEGKPKVALRTKTIMPMRKHKLKRRVELELNEPGVQAVIALVDVFPDYRSAADARQVLLTSAGSPLGFYAHAAQYDVEAWPGEAGEEVYQADRVCRDSQWQEPYGGCRPVSRVQVTSEYPAAAWWAHAAGMNAAPSGQPAPVVLQ